MKNNKIYNLCKKLWPINRSLTGKGNLETLKILKKVHKRLIQVKKFLIGKFLMNGMHMMLGLKM